MSDTAHESGTYGISVDWPDVERLGPDIALRLTGRADQKWFRTFRSVMKNTPIPTTEGRPLFASAEMYLSAASDDIEDGETSTIYVDGVDTRSDPIVFARFFNELLDEVNDWELEEFTDALANLA